MNVSLLLFASFAELAGWSELSVELPDGSTVADAWQATLRAAPALAKWAKPPLVARNREYARVETLLAPGDEIAFLPPIAGG